MILECFGNRDTLHLFPVVRTTQACCCFLFVTCREHHAGLGYFWLPVVRLSAGGRSALLWPSFGRLQFVLASVWSQKMVLTGTLFRSTLNLGFCYLRVVRKPLNNIVPKPQRSLLSFTMRL